MERVLGDKSPNYKASSTQLRKSLVYCYFLSKEIGTITELNSLAIKYRISGLYAFNTKLVSSLDLLPIVIQIMSLLAGVVPFSLGTLR